MTFIKSETKSTEPAFWFLTNYLDNENIVGNSELKSQNLPLSYFWLYAVLCGSCAEGLSVIATDMEQHQQWTCQHRFAACMASTRKETPYVTKACRLKALIRQAFFNYVSHATESRPSPSGGLRPALTRLHGKTTNIGHSRQPLSSSTRNDEEPMNSWQRVREEG